MNDYQLVYMPPDGLVSSRRRLCQRRPMFRFPMIRSSLASAYGIVYTPNHLTIKVENTILTIDFVATPMQIDIAPVRWKFTSFNQSIALHENYHSGTEHR